MRVSVAADNGTGVLLRTILACMVCRKECEVSSVAVSSSNAFRELLDKIKSAQNVRAEASGANDQSAWRVLELKSETLTISSKDRPATSCAALHRDVH